MKNIEDTHISNITSFIERQLQSVVAHAANGHTEYASKLFRTLTDIVSEELSSYQFEETKMSCHKILVSSMEDLVEPVRKQCQSYLTQRFNS